MALARTRRQASRGISCVANIRVTTSHTRGMLHRSASPWAHSGQYRWSARRGATDTPVPQQRSTTTAVDGMRLWTRLVGGLRLGSG
eukprot:scaffold18211_cov45-Tisochrysis_lutea.AAC.1